ncbi:hypothetical protein HJG60_008192 [Phyllostomus discolor]|uniref:Uncharacterized protein n=1 Tax=Phyllostomus discolor TaxID=89673 RepID=A0A834DLX4_9CHIR|nr:hypothetical protein HJG60_008192 [Phyllostomus discolor]
MPSAANVSPFRPEEPHVGAARSHVSAPPAQASVPVGLCLSYIGNTLPSLPDKLLLVRQGPGRSVAHSCSSYFLRSSVPPFVTSNVWSGFVSVFVDADHCGEKMSLSRDDTIKTVVPKGAGGASAGPGRSDDAEAVPRTVL